MKMGVWQGEGTKAARGGGVQVLWGHVGIRWVGSSAYFMPGARKWGAGAPKHPSWGRRKLGCSKVL